MNLMKGEVTGTGEQTTVRTAGGEVTVHAPSRDDLMGATVDLGVRPEDLTVAEDGVNGFVPFDVEISERLGDVTVLYSQATDTADQMVAKLPGIVHVKRGHKLNLTAAPEKLHVFHDGTSLHYM